MTKLMTVSGLDRTEHTTVLMLCRIVQDKDEVNKMKLYDSSYSWLLKRGSSGHSISMRCQHVCTRGDSSLHFSCTLLADDKCTSRKWFANSLTLRIRSHDLYWRKYYCIDTWRCRHVLQTVQISNLHFLRQHLTSLWPAWQLIRSLEMTVSP